MERLPTYVGIKGMRLTVKQSVCKTLYWSSTLHIPSKKIIINKLGYMRYSSYI